MYVLDTNTVIYFFKGIGNVAQNLLDASPKEIGIPAIVIYELMVGIGKSTAPHKRRQELNELLSAIAVISFGPKEAERSALIRVQLENAGIPIGPHDVLIAGTAMAHQATLVTHNRKEFRRIKKLSVEDWY